MGNRNHGLMYLIGALAIVVGGFFLYEKYYGSAQYGFQSGVGGGPNIPVLNSDMKTVNVDPVDKSKFDQKGTAVFSEQNGQVKVTIDVNTPDNLDNQPAHIHLGKCPGVGSIAYNLINVSGGKSETFLPTTINKLRSEEPLAINIHKSDSELGSYTACGNLNF